MPIPDLNLKKKYYLTGNITIVGSALKLSESSTFKSAISNSQKSKDQKVVHREVLGEGLEDRERRREGEGAEGGK